MMIWYKLNVDETLKTLDVDQRSGLTDTEADQRLVQSGANELRQEQKASVLHLLLVQVKNPLIIILMVGVLLSLYTGHTIDAIAIAIIVIINILSSVRCRPS